MEHLYLDIITITLTSFVFSIYLIAFYVFILGPWIDNYRLKKDNKIFKVKVPEDVIITHSYFQPKLSKTVYILGAYLPRENKIIIYNGKETLLHYCATLFHELSHWSEFRVGRKGVNLDEFRTAVGSGDLKTQKIYMMNEMICEKVSEILCKHYRFIGLEKIYRRRRNYIRECHKNIKLGRMEYTYIINEAILSAAYILEKSTKLLA
jgi:hypothetical protein